MACLLARFSVPPLRSSLLGTVAGDAGDGTAVGIWVTGMGLAVAVGSAGAEGVGAETSTVAVAGAGIASKLVAVAAGGVSSSWPFCVQDKVKSNVAAAICIDQTAKCLSLNFMQMTRLTRTSWTLVIDAS